VGPVGKKGGLVGGGCFPRTPAPKKKAPGPDTSMEAKEETKPPENGASESKKKNLCSIWEPTQEKGGGEKNTDDILDRRPKRKGSFCPLWGKERGCLGGEKENWPVMSWGEGSPPGKGDAKGFHAFEEKGGGTAP